MNRLTNEISMQRPHNGILHSALLFQAKIMELEEACPEGGISPPPPRLSGDQMPLLYHAPPPRPPPAEGNGIWNPRISEGLLGMERGADKEAALCSHSTPTRLCDLVFEKPCRALVNCLALLTGPIVLARV